MSLSVEKGMIKHPKVHVGFKSSNKRYSRDSLFSAYFWASVIAYGGTFSGLGSSQISSFSFSNLISFRLDGVFLAS